MQPRTGQATGTPKAPPGWESPRRPEQIKAVAQTHTGSQLNVFDCTVVSIALQFKWPILIFRCPFLSLLLSLLLSSFS